jgi:hypothetical protein
MYTRHGDGQEMIIFCTISERHRAEWLRKVRSPKETGVTRLSQSVILTGVTYVRELFRTRRGSKT